eukprot:scaffold16459_cov111-Isochrysis_galbana.AAC.2
MHALRHSPLCPNLTLPPPSMHTRCHHPLCPTCFPIPPPLMHTLRRQFSVTQQPTPPPPHLCTPRAGPPPCSGFAERHQMPARLHLEPSGITVTLEQTSGEASGVPALSPPGGDALPMGLAPSSGHTARPGLTPGSGLTPYYGLHA